MGLLQKEMRITPQFFLTDEQDNAAITLVSPESSSTPFITHIDASFSASVTGISLTIWAGLPGVANESLTAVLAASGTGGTLGRLNIIGVFQ